MSIVIPWNKDLTFGKEITWHNFKIFSIEIKDIARKAFDFLKYGGF
jgi:hypothetical protein